MCSYQLYHQIISTCPNTLLFLRILTAVLLQKHHQLCVLGVWEIELLLQLKPGMVRMVLRRMNSTLNVTNESQIRFYHAPLRDFIKSKEHAGIYFIDNTEGHAFISQILIKYLGGPVRVRIFDIPAALARHLYLTNASVPTDIPKTYLMND